MIKLQASLNETKSDEAGDFLACDYMLLLLSILDAMLFDVNDDVYWLFGF
jgi:hypothetical protein